MWKSIVAVCFGASVGAQLRWWLSAQLNDSFPPIPLGTLAANLSGGYIVGLAIAAFAAQPAPAPEWRSSATWQKGVPSGLAGPRPSILQVRC